MKFSERRAQCLECFGELKDGMCRVQHDLPCKSDSCIAKRYGSLVHNSQIGWHDRRALERTGLVDEFEKEMG